MLLEFYAVANEIEFLAYFNHFRHNIWYYFKHLILTSINYLVFCVGSMKTIEYTKLHNSFHSLVG